MTQSDQMRDDLSFVRNAVARRDRSRPQFNAPYYIWAAYVLIGYTLLDVNPNWANWFFFLFWLPAGISCGIARHFWAKKRGEVDNDLSQKFKLHFGGGALLVIAAVVALAICSPSFRGPITGQVIVIMFGIVYFLAGVHLDRSFLLLGPVMVVGGIVVGFIPHYGWTGLGIIISGGLCAVALINNRRQHFAATNQD